MNVKKRDIVLFILFAFIVGLLGAFTGLKIYEAKMQPNITSERIELGSKTKKVVEIWLKNWKKLNKCMN